MIETHNGLSEAAYAPENALLSSAKNADPAALIATRLEELRGELAAGEAQMAELDRRRAYLRDTMLRIGGAIQALEEILYTTTSRDESHT